MAVEVTDNKQMLRFEIHCDGELAGFAEYLRHGDVIEFTHTEIDPKFRGHGLASQLVQQALDDVRSRGFAVRPVCPMVREFIAQHDEYKDLVSAEDRKRFDL